MRLDIQLVCEHANHVMHVRNSPATLVSHLFHPILRYQGGPSIANTQCDTA